MYTQEELQEMIHGIQPEVVEQEPVYAGFRPIQQLYILPDGSQVTERIAYLYSADSEAWRTVGTTQLEKQNDRL